MNEQEAATFAVEESRRRRDAALALAQLASSRATLLAFGHAELARLAAERAANQPTDQDDELPF